MTPPIPSPLSSRQSQASHPSIPHVQNREMASKSVVMRVLIEQSIIFKPNLPVRKTCIGTILCYDEWRKDEEMVMEVWDGDNDVVVNDGDGYGVGSNDEGNDDNSDRLAVINNGIMSDDICWLVMTWRVVMAWWAVL